MKRPHSIKNSAIVMMRKVLSLKIRKSGSILLREIGLPGSRDLMRRFARTTKKTKVKPRALVAHAKPAEVNREESINGKKMPPSDPAQLAIPVANPRRTLKKCPMVPIATVDNSEVPRPPMTPNTMMKCQYSCTVWSAKWVLRNGYKRFSHL